MKEDSIRAGEYRTVKIDDQSTVIVETSGPFSQLRQVLRVSCVGDSMMGAENCAVILAMALNAGVDTMSAHDALSEHTGEGAERARNQALRSAIEIARNGCLVLPDGGSPSIEEVEVCDRIVAAISRLLGDVS